MHQIYRRTPIPKCTFNKVALQLYWNHTSVWVFSCKSAVFFKKTYIPRSTSGELYMKPKWINMIAILKLKFWSYDVISSNWWRLSLTHLFLIFVNLITEVFEWEKKPLAIATFKKASITCRWMIHILYEARNYRYSTLCEQTRLVKGGYHWYKNFLMLTSNIFISNIISIVVN